MKEKPILEEHYNENVWTNKPMDIVRKKECMCWSCELIKPSNEDNCKFAQALFKVCQDGGIAIMVTRCRDFVQRAD